MHHRQLILSLVTALSLGNVGLADASPTESTPPVPCSAAEVPADPVMADVREAIANGLAGTPADEMRSDALIQLAERIDAQRTQIDATGLSKSCRQTFYMILGDIRDGLELMKRARRVEAQRVGLHKVMQAVNLYGQYFHQPGWPALSR